jgi:hypothetical protein
VNLLRHAIKPLFPLLQNVPTLTWGTDKLELKGGQSLLKAAGASARWVCLLQPSLQVLLISPCTEIPNITPLHTRCSAGPQHMQSTCYSMG